jgi:hypothetical protein
MGDILPESREVDRLQGQLDDYVPQKCTFGNCKEQQVFPTKLSLKYATLLPMHQNNSRSHLYRRHQDKHTRPYVCHQQPCTNKSFGDKAGQQRHEREAHGSETDSYPCPFRSCKRNKRGFHRRYNLLEHQKRSHGIQPSASPTGLSPLDGSLEREDSQGIHSQGSRHSGGSDMPESLSRGLMYGNANTGTEQDLMAKLHHLKEARAELDEDITSLERVLGIVRGRSP